MGQLPVPSVPGRAGPHSGTSTCHVCSSTGTSAAASTQPGTQVKASGSLLATSSASLGPAQAHPSSHCPQGTAQALGEPHSRPAQLAVQHQNLSRSML